ncbi:BadF/BadG/BcrA/BcrD ATPase family protein [Aureimonas ureilytica]|uniref:BadF/BadG/BcrA/BcrD ATPase family protein n=1 Tax=Aureimonas ureilytica TaxID=401562 RepID=UPI003CF0E4BB
MSIVFLGIDAGGTSCRARLIDESGTLFGEGAAGPASARLGVEAVFDALMSAAREAWRAAGLGPFAFGRVRAAAGIAGYLREGVADSFAARPHPFESLTLTDDGTIACLGAHGGADGGVVIAGTGSIAYARQSGRTLRFGGYGFPASDEGSGARLGLAAMEAAFQALDGRLQPTPLTEALLDRFGTRAPAMTLWCEGATPTDYASLAPLVTLHAERGDKVAQLLMESAGDALAALAATLEAAGCARVVLTGGLSPAILPYLPQALARRLAEPMGDALDGALALAGLPLAPAMSDAR